VQGLKCNTAANTRFVLLAEPCNSKPCWATTDWAPASVQRGFQLAGESTRGFVLYWTPSTGFDPSPCWLIDEDSDPTDAGIALPSWPRDMLPTGAHPWIESCSESATRASILSDGNLHIEMTADGPALRDSYGPWGLSDTGDVAYTHDRNWNIRVDAELPAAGCSAALAALGPALSAACCGATDAVDCATTGPAPATCTADCAALWHSFASLCSGVAAAVIASPLGALFGTACNTPRLHPLAPTTITFAHAANPNGQSTSCKNAPKPYSWYTGTGAAHTGAASTGAASAYDSLPDHDHETSGYGAGNGDNGCLLAYDGECDEPDNCVSGTDTSDCQGEFANR
jgi:hypothetical protein